MGIFANQDGQDTIEYVLIGMIAVLLSVIVIDACKEFTNKRKQNTTINYTDIAG